MSLFSAFPVSVLTGDIASAPDTLLQTSIYAWPRGQFFLNINSGLHFTSLKGTWAQRTLQTSRPSH